MTKIAIPSAGWSYQFLILPTFHPISYITLEELGTSLELSLTILSYEMEEHDFYHVFTQEKPMPSINYPSWADIIELSDSERIAAHQQFKQIEPTSLRDIDLAMRDGIGIRCWYRDPQTEHSFQMRSPTKRDNPRHHSLMLILIELIRTNFDDPTVQTYLSALERYF